MFVPSLFAQRRAEILYSFCDPVQHCVGGANPVGIITDSRGNFYGIANSGGANNQGLVFELSRSSDGESWTETVLYNFCSLSGCRDGRGPGGTLVRDAHGNLYGTTRFGGEHDDGVIFELSPPPGGSGAWTETVIYRFCSVIACRDGKEPLAGLIMDSGGNLYGTTSMGGSQGNGVAFKLAPPTGGSGPWSQTVLYPFCLQSGCRDGRYPQTELTIGSDGNLYGTTQIGGVYRKGVVFELTPAGGQYGFWAEKTLHDFCDSCPDGNTPSASVVFDAHRNLYGTTIFGGSDGGGIVFQLTPPAGGSGQWEETVALNFGNNGSPKGYTPSGAMVLDSGGNLYGVTVDGGSQAHGVVYELSQSRGSWNETVLYNFLCSFGCYAGPNSSGLIFDHDGMLYGTRPGGDYAGGEAYKLVPVVGTTTALATAPNPSYLDQNVVMTATVTARDGSTPGGVVVFMEDGSEVATVALSGSGGAEFNDASMRPGSHRIDAIYQGSPAYEWSASNWVGQSVDSLRQSFTTVTGTPNPSVTGDMITITATVTPYGPPMPIGTVGFVANDEFIPGCEAITLSDAGTAVCTTSTLAIGMNSVSANYYGDSEYHWSEGSMWQIVNPVPRPLQFVAMPPCRVVDTRKANGPLGGPAIQGGSARSFALPQGNCDIPSSAAAYSLNATVIPSQPLAYLTLWPSGENKPLVSTMNSTDGRIKANAAIVPAGDGGAVSFYASDTTNVVVDVDGYFVSPGAMPGVQSSQFYTVTPCRVIDTRMANGPLGGPYLAGSTRRDFAIADSACLPPRGDIQAYSFNVTAVPHPQGQIMGYLTLWPEGDAQPAASTLNNLTATVVANAAIVSAGSGGGMSVFPSNDTDLVVDVDGYFAPPGAGGLSLYPTAPCRALDTRNNDGHPFNGQETVNVEGGMCAPPASARAYVFNATVVPQGSLGYLTLWPDGQGQPGVSTLNAIDGFTTSNMAIVPTQNGSVDAYASGLTHLVLDISSYFAP